MYYRSYDLPDRSSVTTVNPRITNVTEECFVMKIVQYHQQHRELQVMLTNTVLVVMFKVCSSMMAKAEVKTKGGKK
jgi:hypothetical protein